MRCRFGKASSFMIRKLAVWVVGFVLGGVVAFGLLDPFANIFLNAAGHFIGDYNWSVKIYVKEACIIAAIVACLCVWVAVFWFVTRASRAIGHWFSRA